MSETCLHLEPSVSDVMGLNPAGDQEGSRAGDSDVNPQRRILQRFVAAGEIYGAKLAAVGCRSAMTLLGVSRLALPPLRVEMEATAAK